MPVASDDFTKRLHAALNGMNGATSTAKPANGHLAGVATAATGLGWDAGTAGATGAQSAPGAPQVSTVEQEDSSLPATASDAGPVGGGEHIVREGECISSIAKTTGHFWHTIWEDAGNSVLRETRRQPNVLLPGDRVVVPPIRRKDEPGQSETRQRFVRRGEPSHFAVRVLDQDLPRANEPFSLVIDGGKPITGMTDPEGKLDVPISGSARAAVLTIGAEPDALTFTFNLGGLPPIASWEGVQARLRNLGLSCNETGERDEQTIDALNEFRHSVDLPRSDDIDDATRSELLRKHGS